MFDRFTSNASFKILSVLISVVLWFVVLGSRNVEVTKDVPIEVVTPGDLLVSGEVPEKVSFRISGPKAFLRNILNRKEDPIRVNLTSAKAGVVTYRFFSDNITVPLGVKVLAINPGSVSVKLEPNKKKEVPVRLVLRGAAQPGFKIQTIELIRTNIRIRGPESKIDQISELATLPIEISDLRDFGEKEVSVDLGQYPGVYLDSEVPKMRYSLQYNLGTYKIRNADVKVLTNRRFEVTPKEVTIMVKAPSETLKSLTSSQAYVTVDVRNRGPGTYTNLQVVPHLPENLKLIKVMPNAVKVTLY